MSSSAATSAATNAAAQQAAVTQAIRASGVLVQVTPEELLSLLDTHPEALVVCTSGGFFSTTYQYLTSYRGLAFYAKSSEELRLPAHCQVIQAQKMWIP